MKLDGNGKEFSPARFFENGLCWLHPGAVGGILAEDNYWLTAGWIYEGHSFSPSNPPPITPLISPAPGAVVSKPVHAQKGARFHSINVEKEYVSWLSSDQNTPARLYTNQRRENMPIQHPPRQKPFRRDKDIVLATQRDIQVMSYIAHMDAVRRDHLRIVFSAMPGGKMKGVYLADSTLKDQIERYRKAGWIEYQRYLSEPGWCWATKRGLDLVGLDGLYTARAPSVVRYRHLWAVNEVRMFWYRSDDEELVNGVWVSERQLRAEMAGVKRRKNGINADEDAYAHAPVQISRGAIPDAVIAGENWCDAIEVELTPKKPDEVKAKLERLCFAMYRERSTGEEYVYNEIHFYVPNTSMEKLVNNAREKLRGELDPDRISVVVDEDLQQQKPH